MLINRRAKCLFLILVTVAVTPLVGKTDGAGGWAAGHGGVAATARQIDLLLTDELARNFEDLQFADLADDQVFLRRAYLDLVGKLPTPAQIRQFTGSTDPDKRTALVQSLLEDESFGVNWGRYWRDVIYFRRLEERAMLGAEPTRAFFTEQFNKNTPGMKSHGR